MDGTKRPDEPPPSYSQLFSEPSPHGSSTIRQAGYGYSPVRYQHQYLLHPQQEQRRQPLGEYEALYAQSVFGSGQPQHIVARPLATAVQEPEQQFGGHLVLALFACLCCGGCLGCIALGLAVMAQCQARSSPASARCLARSSAVISTIGIVVFLAAFALYIGILLLGLNANVDKSTARKTTVKDLKKDFKISSRFYDDDDDEDDYEQNSVTRFEEDLVQHECEDKVHNLDSVDDRPTTVTPPYTGLNHQIDHGEERLEFDTRSFNVTIRTGKTVWLPCTVRNLGKYKVAWLEGSSILTYDTRRVVEDPRITVYRPEVANWYLQVRNVQRSDDGPYRCVVNTSPLRIKKVCLTVID